MYQHHHPATRSMKSGGCEIDDNGLIPLLDCHTCIYWMLHHVALIPLLIDESGVFSFHHQRHCACVFVYYKYQRVSGECIGQWTSWNRVALYYFQDLRPLAQSKDSGVILLGFNSATDLHRPKCPWASGWTSQTVSSPVEAGNHWYYSPQVSQRRYYLCAALRKECQAQGPLLYKVAFHRFCQITSPMDLCARWRCTLSQGFASNLSHSWNG